jgi:hypothetical protein
MIRSVPLAVCSLFLSSVALSESPACPEAQTMQSLLTEVRQLRQDPQRFRSRQAKRRYSFTGCTYRKRSFNTFQKIWKTRKLRSVKCESSRKFQTEQMKRYGEAKDRSDDPTHRKQMDDMTAQFRSRLETENSVEQEM